MSTDADVLVANTGALAMTLGPPTQDLLLKAIQLIDATHAATVSGTNVLGQSGKLAHFASAGVLLLLTSVGGQWVQIGGNVTWS